MLLFAEASVDLSIDNIRTTHLTLLYCYKKNTEVTGASQTSNQARLAALGIHVFTYNTRVPTTSEMLKRFLKTRTTGQLPIRSIVPLDGDRTTVFRSIRSTLWLLRLVRIVLNWNGVLCLGVRDAALLALHRSTTALALALLEIVSTLRVERGQ